MSNRMREDEKNEKIIRGLLKLPVNKRCINCNNMGPQYVCTNLWIFICTNCSGIHREFTHRVKSISMAKFTTQEVSSLQEGGNERAREIYFKDWDPQRHSFPDSSNIDRLRDFIKHVYVDRRYSGGRNSDESMRMKGEKDSEYRKTDVYRGGSRSPPYEDERHSSYSDRSGSGGRNEDKNTRYGYEERSPAYERSPGRIEVADDRRRDENYVNGDQIRRFEDPRFPNALQRPGGGSPNYQKDIDASSPPMVRPVSDILGDDVPKLQVGEPPKLIAIKGPEHSAKTQRTASSSSMGSSDGNSVESRSTNSTAESRSTNSTVEPKSTNPAVESKSVNSTSLIDFFGDTEPSIPDLSPQAAPQQSTTSPSGGGNWASFDVTSQQTTLQAPPVSTSSLESMLMGLSTPAAAPVGDSAVISLASIDATNRTSDGQHLPPMQQPPMFSAYASDGIPTTLMGAPVVVPINPNVQGLSAALPSRPSLPGTTVLPQEATGGILSQPNVEAKIMGRKELPQDLFTSMYSSAPTSFHGWQRAPHFGMGYGMHYPSANAPMPVFPQAPRSSNPFDLSSQPPLAHSSSFPNMTALQGALPTVAGNSSLHRTSSLGSPTQQQQQQQQQQQWFPPQQQQQQWLPPQQQQLQQQWLPPQHQQQRQPFPSGLTASPYMPQQGSNNLPQRQMPADFLPGMHHGIGGIGIPGMDQVSSPIYPYHVGGDPNPLAPFGGNPFG